jgi:hypothetical protein
MGHFETKSDAYRCESIGLILLHELTFWSARNVSARSSCTFSTRHPRQCRSVRCRHLEHVADPLRARRFPVTQNPERSRENVMGPRRPVKAPRRERRTTAGQTQQPCRQAYGRDEGPRRLEDREGCCGGRASRRRGRPWPGALSGDLLGADAATVMRWFILVVALLLDPAAVLLLLAATRTRA